MPVKSKAELRFMGGVCKGSIRSPGLSSSKACEFVHSTRNAKALPERVGKKDRKLKRRTKSAKA